MNSSDNSIGLQGDARRRASATVRGFLYQFWRTVEAWIELEPEELLFVEGAEDFDRLCQDEATAAQVKDNRASGPLTLSSADAINALGNFWKLKKDNPGRKIRFKFITTADAGTEKTWLADEKGIEVWDVCRQSPLSACSKDVERIRDFLLSKQSLNPNLAGFLRKASVDDIWQELIEPFEWLCNQPSLADVNEIVVGRLLKIGVQQGLTATDAGRLAERLCMIVAKAAVAKSPQRLSFINFREQLDRAVNIEVPRSALQRQEVYAGVLDSVVKAGLDLGETKLPKVTEVVDKFAAPVLGRRIWPRGDLIKRVQSALRSGIAYVDGSAGMGKTTLVRQALVGEKQLLWAGLRDRTMREILEICRDLQYDARNRVSPMVVLDDLNPNEDPRNLESELGRLTATVRDRQGGLAIISYKPAGPRLASVLGLSTDGRINVPPFEEEEVRKFLVTEGCPPDQAKELGRIVWLHTSGHPQLVAARINALKSAAFPKPAAEDIIDQPKEIRDARAEVLNVVRSVLPENARNLLYRLSLAIPPLKRSHALRIAAADPPIPQAGEMFDYLVGPWLESPSQDRFRVSPLVSRAGEQVLTPEESKRLHRNIVTALLAEKRMTVNEFTGIVVHALSGGAETQSAIAAKVFLTAPKEIKEAVSKELPWVAAIGIEPSTHLPISNKAVRQFFRLFQWDIARFVAPQYLEPLNRIMEGDFAAETNQLVDVLPRILYLSKLLLESDFPISPDRVVTYVLEFWRLVESANTQNAKIDIGGKIPPMHAGLKRSIFSDFFTVTLIPRVRTVEDLRKLISALDALDKRDRDRLLEGFKTDDGELRILFNGPWLSIKRGDERSHEEYVKVLQDALSAGRRWQHHPWMRAVTRILSAILDEMLDRREDAERIVAETIKEVGPSPNLEEQLAIIAFNRKEYGKALDIWQRVLPNWTSDRTLHDMQPLFGTRCAGIAAAMIGSWNIAADLFRQAIKRAVKFGIRPWKIGLLGDRGYALWKSGDRKQAVKVFSECVEVLEALPNKPESFSEYAVQKLVGHTLASLATQGGALATPIPGMCSNPDPDERIKELPPSPSAYSWFLVYTLAREAGDDRLAIRCVEKFRDAPFSFLRATAARDSLERHLKSRSLKSAVQLAAKVALEMEKAFQRKDTPPNEPDPPGLTAQLTERSINTYIRPTLWAGILRAKLLGRNITNLVEGWQNDSDPDQPYIVDELALCHTFSRMMVGELATILKNRDEARKKRLLASVLLLGHEDTSPLDTLYAQVMLITMAKEYELLWEVAAQSFDSLVRKDWHRFSGNRFLLRDPGIYIDGIREACGSQNQGWSAAAKIILTASPTVNLRFPDDLWNKIKELAEAK